MRNFTPRRVAAEIADALIVSRESRGYKLGLAQLKEWHERCRAKRLGIVRKPKTVGSFSTVKWNAHRAKKEVR